MSKQQLRNDLSKPIIRPWEEIRYNRQRKGLGYEKDVTFHIPEYSKPIQFVSVGFINEESNQKFHEESNQQADENHMEEIPEC